MRGPINRTHVLRLLTTWRLQHKAKKRVMHSYAEALRRIPAPGAGCHPALLGVANLGAKSRLDASQIVADIRAAVPSGNRRVSDREIHDAVAKAVREHDHGWHGERYGSGLNQTSRQDFTHRQRAEKAAREQAKRTIDAIPKADPVELWERSPVRLTDGPREDAQLLLRGLFNSDERVWVGDTFEKHEPAKPGNWCERWAAGESLPAFIILNPLTGDQAETGAGTLSYRCDAAIAVHRFALVEFDDLTINEQVGRVLWLLDNDFDVTAVVHSGGKSLHAWVRVNAVDAEAWRRDVREQLFPRLFIPLGADPACTNPARLSRLPGAARDNAHQQRLLYFDPGRNKLGDLRNL